MNLPRLGLYLDLRNPDGSRSTTDVYRRSLERVEYGERHALGAVWTTEHHASPDGYLPAPLTALAAVAARTSQVRLGTAVALAPLRHPITLAEEAAVVDVLSGGRLELGLGAGWRRSEFDAFGADFDARYRTTERVLRELPEIWASGRATPRPVQDPVPLWWGARGPIGARRAGRLGIGLLWLDRDLWEPYAEGLAEGGHHVAAARMGGLVNVFLADDPDRARALITPHARAARGATYRGAQTPGRPSSLPRLQFRTPEDAAADVAGRIRGLPVTDVFCFDRIGGAPEELCDRHVELLCGAFRTALARDPRPGNRPTVRLGGW
ncbi:hypothetical protein BJF90_08555 [Pseudonocardia sp. CNS-004]|nr:hypothetical protein BJF90_08555 [Pseudonocardia sp. CNS-004]